MKDELGASYLNAKQCTTPYPQTGFTVRNYGDGAAKLDEFGSRLDLQHLESSM